MSIPRYFCWTRFGAEAGETVEAIIERKELERIANGGIFLWGVGNAIGPSILELIKLEPNPEVIFSPMRSTPQEQDSSPSEIVVWNSAETLDGEPYTLPSHSRVTSRAATSKKRKINHYALVCESQVELDIRVPLGDFEYGQLKHIKTGRPIGFSQVTSVVEKEDSLSTSTPQYSAVLRAQLVYPYFIKFKLSSII